MHGSAGGSWKRVCASRYLASFLPDPLYPYWIVAFLGTFLGPVLVVAGALAVLVLTALAPRHDPTAASVS
jgi:hypothetical protein